MDILYSSSDSYAFLTGISILSLLENNRECDAIHIYIMDNHISDINKNKLIEVVKEYRRDISFVPMPDMKELTGQEIDTRRWNISTFGRLYMASALPETVHKVLNIDCDTIIVDTIEPLWNTDMTGKVFGGMLECINDRYRRNVGKNDGDYYLNGGIVFLNLDEVRVGNYERKFTDYITKYGSSLAYLDQDVLNGVVEQEKKVKLPMRYNTLSIYFYGVPSPRVYNSYLHYLERKMKSKIKEFIFRDKIGGWHKHVEKIIYENGKIEYRDGYTQLFYTNLPLRRSCGECPFSTIKRCGDFTVGDFWGVQDVLPEFDDNKGVSLLFFNNDRTLERFDSFKEMLKYQEISVTDAVRQPNLKGHSVIPKNVNAFWRDFQKKGIGYCISFYSPAGIPFRIKRKIKYIYSKVTRK